MAGVRWTTRKPVALLCLLAAALAVAAIAPGCGEKAEPESSGPPPTADTGTTGFDIIGMWEGRLTQKQVKPFTVSATIGSLDDPKLNTVHYTGIDCEGGWTYLGKEGEAFRFREVIDPNQVRGECKGTGVVTLTPTDDGRLQYEFQGGGVTSRGVLVRTG
jgi:hypothetical protein